MGNIAASLSGDSAKTFLEECRVYSTTLCPFGRTRNGIPLFSFHETTFAPAHAHRGFFYDEYGPLRVRSRIVQAAARRYR